MKSLANILGGLVAVGLLGVGTVRAQINMPNPQMPGGSFESAVRLVVTSDIMVDRQIARWLRTHYNGWDADPHEFQEIGDERYAVVYLTHKDHSPRRVYFRLLRSHADPDNQGPDFPL